MRFESCRAFITWDLLWCFSNYFFKIKRVTISLILKIRETVIFPSNIIKLNLTVRL